MIGTIPWLLSASGAKNALYEECNLGDAAADALLRTADCDIAIVNGGDLCANLLPGDLTQSELEESFSAGRTLAVAEVTPRILVRILEGAVSHVALSGRSIDAAASANGAFPQIAGFRFTYDPGAVPGQRIASLKIGDTSVDLDDNTTVLRLAATVYMLSGGYEQPTIEAYQTLDCTLTDAMADYIAAGLDDYSRPANRITAIGIERNTLPIVYLALLCGLLFAVAGLFGTTAMRRKVVPDRIGETDGAAEDAEHKITESCKSEHNQESTKEKEKNV